jgi:hypothetical protein
MFLKYDLLQAYTTVYLDVHIMWAGLLFCKTAIFVLDLQLAGYVSLKILVFTPESLLWESK